MSWTYNVNKLRRGFQVGEDEEQNPDTIRLFANPVAECVKNESANERGDSTKGGLTPRARAFQGPWN